MSTKVILNVTGKDFLIACKLFDIDPGRVVESIVNSISLVRYWSAQPRAAQGELIRLATDYFMEYAPKAAPENLPIETIKRVSDKYIPILTNLPGRISDPAAREQSARVLVYRWLEEVCAAQKRLQGTAW